MQNKNEQKLKPHMIAFVDFMGTRDTVKKEEKKNQLFELLLWVHNEMRNEGYFKAGIEGNGCTIQAKVTSFSDNIVITIPISNDVTLGSDWNLALDHIQDIIFQLFLKASENNFLIRGAIDIGDLYHEKHMVFGNALINAYEHEQKAFYPRIILTDNCLAKRQDYMYLNDLDPNVFAHILELKILDFRNLPASLGLLERVSTFKDFDGTICMRFIPNNMHINYLACYVANLPKDVKDMYRKGLLDFNKCIRNIEQNINNCNDSYLRKNWEWMNNYIQIEKSFFEIFKQHESLIQEHLQQQKETSIITD
jgi:hypothetical protein